MQKPLKILRLLCAQEGSQDEAPAPQPGPPAVTRWERATRPIPHRRCESERRAVPTVTHGCDEVGVGPESELGKGVGGNSSVV